MICLNNDNLSINVTSINDLIEKNPNSIIATDLNNNIKYINESAKSLFDLENKNLIKQNIYSIIPSLKKIKFNEGTIYSINENNDHYNVVPIRLKDKNEELVNLYIIIEIEGRNKLKQEFKNQQEIIDELNEILEGSYDGILVTDGDGKVILVNSSYERVAAIKREDMWGKTMRDLMNPVWMPNSVAYVVIEQKQAVSKRQITQDGRNIIVTGMPVFDKNGNIKKVVINARDISEIYELREELLKEKQLNHLYSKSYKEFIEKGDNSDYVLAVSKPMQDVMNLARKVANFQATVLVLGDSGVGKEVVAKYIHKNSIRKDKPFITINCGAIPENLMESEIFGYEKGAFTGANNLGKAGLLEVGHEGTIFLDEIGEMSMDLQVKLLRFLETKEVRRIGSVDGKIVDVRIIAATNSDLDAMVEEGTFRDDLFYRLNVVRIKIPPLRDRAADITPLSIMFLYQYNKKYNQNKEFTMDVIKELEKYSWPGNIRELKNVIENMTIISNNEYLQTEDLPWNKEKNAGHKIVSMLKDSENLTLTEATELLEKTMLEKAKIKYKTTRSMAESLGVDQSTIVRKLKKYNL